MFRSALSPLFIGLALLTLIGCGNDGPSVPMVEGSSAELALGKFESMADVLDDPLSTHWFDSRDTSGPITLHFNFYQGYARDTLVVSFNPECWATFPMSISSDTAFVRWMPVLDSKYDFTIVQAIRKLGKRFQNEHFMKLWLANDTTLEVEYPNSKLMAALRIEGARTRFPDRIHPGKALHEE